jgi:transcriptional regulator with XRE-family HTH domain
MDHSPTPTSLPALVRERRAALGLSQSALAERLQVPQSVVSSWETGQNRPRMPRLIELAEALAVDVGELARAAAVRSDYAPTRRA